MAENCKNIIFVPFLAQSGFILFPVCYFDEKHLVQFIQTDAFDKKAVCYSKGSAVSNERI